MNRLIHALVLPYRPWLAVVLAAMLVEVLMSLAAPWPLKLILDDALSLHQLPRGLEWAHELGIGRHTLGVALFAGIATLAIAIVGGIAAYIENYYTASIGQWVGNDLRIRVYEHMHRLSLAYYNHTESASLISTITTDVATVQNFASSSTLGILVDILTIMFMLGLMVWLNWDFTLIAMAAMPFLLLFAFRVKRAVKVATQELRCRQSEIVALVQESIQTVQAVTAFGRQRLEIARMRAASRASTDVALKARKIKFLLPPVIAVVIAACTAIVLWKGTALIMIGAMTPGALIVYLAYLRNFFKPVKDLGGMASTLAQASVALDRIQKILGADDFIREQRDALGIKLARGEVTFESVVYGFDNGPQVLNRVSFSVYPGQVLGIVGPSGSGKSTLVGLIPRFYDPSAGHVLVDGIDVRRYKVSELRSQIGFVLQETVLFRGSIAENIAYGRPDATTAQIVNAAKLANADEFIRRMPNGYESRVGERGATLSGGQRQRIGIARAVIRDSPILIFDEPTSALDPESEKLVVEGMARLMKGRTVIMIAHRLSTVRGANRIIVLDNGIVVEDGTNDQLLEKGGVYAQLYGAQHSDLAQTS